MDEINNVIFNSVFEGFGGFVWPACPLEVTQATVSDGQQGSSSFYPPTSVYVRLTCDFSFNIWNVVCNYFCVALDAGLSYDLTQKVQFPDSVLILRILSQN